MHMIVPYLISYPRSMLHQRKHKLFYKLDTSSQARSVTQESMGRRVIISFDPHPSLPDGGFSKKNAVLIATRKSLNSRY